MSEPDRPFPWPSLSEQQAASVVRSVLERRRRGLPLRDVVRPLVNCGFDAATGPVALETIEKGYEVGRARASRGEPLPVGGDVLTSAAVRYGETAWKSDRNNRVLFRVLWAATLLTGGALAALKAALAHFAMSLAH